MILPETPFLSDLRGSIEALYRLAPEYVPRSLMVCSCPVCMSDEMLAQIIATPVRDLDPDLIREYTNSAHGVPSDPDDLNALLPRYLDLIAQDIAVDLNGVGTELIRFGDARASLPGFPSARIAPELDRAAHLLLLHFGALQTMTPDTVETPWTILQILAVGGWAPDVLTQAMDDLFARPDFGSTALFGFVTELGRSLQDGKLVCWALMRYRAEVAPKLSAWIAGLLSSDPVAEILTDPTLPEEIQVWINALAGLRDAEKTSLIRG